jgi:hypothetical protein
MNVPRSRWTLALLLKQCDWLALTTEAGLSQLLKRIGISYKRGRSYIHSPDAHYADKNAVIELCRSRARHAQERYAFLYQDEFTYYRQPTLAYDYEAAGSSQPLAHRSQRSNTTFRIAATLDAFTGQVIYRQASRITRHQLVKLFADVADAYPGVETIYMVVDNWPVHFHPGVLSVLEPQRHLDWPRTTPANWPSHSTAKPKHTDLPIQLLPLPTYASWLHPIEKLWRWLKQDILHHHRYSDNWSELKQRIADWLDAFAQSSQPLLRYV